MNNVILSENPIGFLASVLSNEDFIKIEPRIVAKIARCHELKIKSKIRVQSEFMIYF